MMICTWARWLWVGTIRATVGLAGLGVSGLVKGAALEVGAITIFSASDKAGESVVFFSCISWLSSWNLNLEGGAAGNSLKTRVVAF